MILLIAVPIIFNIIDGVKKSAFESSTKGVVKSVENLSILDKLKGTEDDIAITFTDSISSNPNLELIGDAPKSGTIIMYKDGTIEFALHSGEYCATKNISSSNITVIKKDSADCTLELPEITLIGNSTINLAFGDTFTDPGVDYPTGSVTTTIKKNGVVVENIDTNSYGTFEITYKITVGEKFNTVIRTVIIEDTEAPILTVPSYTTIGISEAATYDLMVGVSVSDNSGEILTIEHTELPAELGTHVISYTATDSSGNTATALRTIEVINPALVDTSTLTSAQIAAIFTGNSNTSRGTTTYVDGGVIQTSAAAWDGGFVTFNNQIPKTGKLYIEYEFALNTPHYSNASIGGTLILHDASVFVPTSTTTYYNQPYTKGIYFDTFSGALTDANYYKWNVAAKADVFQTPSFNIAALQMPTFAINTFYKINIYFNLDTGYFEYKCNNTLISSATFDAPSLSNLGSNFYVTLSNGNYTSQITTYKNIKIEVK